MNIFYNPEATNDTLILIDKRVEHDQEEKVGNIVCLLKNSQVIGYNILNISEYITIEQRGYIREISQELVNVVNELITKAGYESIEFDLSPKFVVGKIEQMEKHPDADALQICQVNIGKDENIQIVTAAKNVREGMLTSVALPGAFTTGGLFIQESKLRGELSQGMFCGYKTLGIDKEDQDGFVVDLNNQVKLGADIYKNL